jgi:hypothetical protein
MSSTTSTTFSGDDGTVFQGASRLESPLLPGERLVPLRGLEVLPRPDGGSILVCSAAEVEIAELEPELLRRLLAKLDGRTDVDEVCDQLSADLDAETTRAVLTGLCGSVLRIAVDRDRAPTGRPSLIVVDDFLPDPDSRRAEALQATFQPVEWFRYPGDHSLGVPDNLASSMARIEKLVGTRLLHGAGAIHGHYRCSLARHRDGISNIHTDPTSWNGVLCLTPTRLCSGGISFYRHRASGALGRDPSLLRDFDGSADDFDEQHARHLEEGCAPEKWDEVARVDVRFNRLILINPRFFHNVNALFGDSVATARLTQGFSAYAFDDPYRYELWV